MKTFEIDGYLFEKMLRNALNNLRLHEEELNALNVFPVSDGDTGTNMQLTLEHGLAKAKRTRHVGNFLQELGSGMLLGARGNSGVILSQIFKGISIALVKDAVTNPGRIRNAFIRGYRQAYEAVVNPVEGTILTVAREGVENIKNQVTRETSLEVFFGLYISEMKKSLERTPELLEALKEAGVIDSGALGFIYIVEGMQKFLTGEVLVTEKGIKRSKQEKAMDDAINDETLFNENSRFEDGYCMEFLLQLMRASSYSQLFKINDFIKDLSNYGNSLVVVQEGRRVKVHIHTLKPARIIAIAQEFGEFVSFKLENMQLQHNHRDEKTIVKKKEHKALFKIAAANGEGFESMFEQFGCDVIIRGGASLNTAAKDFLDAIMSADADRIVIFPNNPNSVRAAEQAIKLSGLENVRIIPTHDMVSCYYALAMDVMDHDDPDFRLSEMEMGMDCVTNIAIATATKDYSSEDISFKAGDVAALVNDKPIAYSQDIISSVIKAIDKIDPDREREGCTLFRGIGIPDEKADELTEAIAAAYPRLEINVIEGGQDVYHWFVGLL